MEKASKLYVTKIDADFEGDTFFPEIDSDLWSEVSREKGIRDEKNPYDYEYVTYLKKV